MTHNQLNYYLNHEKSTIADSLQRLSDTGTNSLSHATYAHKAAVLQKNDFPQKMRDTSLLYFAADLEEFMHCVERKEGLNDYFRELTTSRYTYENGFKFHEEMMIENILYLMDNQKIIFFQMGVPDYMTSQTDKGTVYDAHALCIIMVPNKDMYDCYYINSHGHTIDTQHHYEFIMSKRRSRMFKLKEPADVVFMKALVQHINTNGDIKVNYDGTSKYTYRGTNLQVGDSHGVCYVYPLIIWYHFGKFYTKRQVLETEFGKIHIPTGKSLMKDGKFNHFIESLFYKFCPKHFELLAHQYNMNSSQQKFSSVLENSIAKENFRFIKMLIGPYSLYIQQSGFKLKISAN